MLVLMEKKVKVINYITKKMLILLLNITQIDQKLGGKPCDDV